VIFVDGDAIGGYEELAAIVRAGELKHISAAA
jgi:glutaredoxin-related protein